MYTSRDPVVLVITPSLLNYEYSVDVPNWAWGVLAKDTLNLEVGRALAVILGDLCKQTFAAVDVLPSLDAARRVTPPRATIVPRVDGAQLTPPMIRWTEIPAQITVTIVVSMPDGAERQLTLTGHGTHRLIASKENHSLAMSDALRDLSDQLSPQLVKLVGGD